MIDTECWILGKINEDQTISFIGTNKEGQLVEWYDDKRALRFQTEFGADLFRDIVAKKLPDVCVGYVPCKLTTYKP